MLTFLKDADPSRYLIYVGFLAIFVVFSIVLRDDGFATASNLLNIVQQTAPVTVMENRSVLTAFAALRVYLGVVWFTYGRSKFEPNWAGGHHEFLSAVNDAAKGTGEPFRSLLTHVVIPNQAVFAQLIAFGETLVGISLILGLLTRAGAAGDAAAKIARRSVGAG